METPSLDILPDLIADVTPLSEPSPFNPTPFHDLGEKEYFTSKLDSKTVVEYGLPFRPNATSIIASPDDHQKELSTPKTITVEDVLNLELNPTNPIFNSVPFVPALKGRCFANPAQAFWYRNTSPHFSRLLDNAGYPAHLKKQYLNFFNHSIIPALGPIPSPEARWTSHPNYIKCPFEPAWKLGGQDRVTPRQQIRFTIEPTGPLAGTSEDPFNQLVPSFFVPALASSKICPNIDLERWGLLADYFFVTAAEMQQALELLPSHRTPPTCLFAFDLPTNGFAPMLKPYLFPQRRALFEGTTNTEVILSAVRKLDSPTLSLLPAVERIEAFLSSSKQDLQESDEEDSTDEPEPSEMSLEIMSFDCNPSSSNPRIKLYLKTTNTSISHIQQIYTLSSFPSSDSDLSQETTTALNLFKEFWEFLTGLEQEWESSTSQTSPFLYLSLELVPGASLPTVEVFVPAWKCGISEAGVREGLRNFLIERGWGVGDEYKGMLGEGLSHTYLGFVFSEEWGIFVTMHYSSVLEGL